MAAALTEKSLIRTACNFVAVQRTQASVWRPSANQRPCTRQSTASDDPTGAGGRAGPRHGHLSTLQVTAYGTWRVAELTKLSKRSLTTACSLPMRVMAPETANILSAKLADAAF